MTRVWGGGTVALGRRTGSGLVGSVSQNLYRPQSSVFATSPSAVEKLKRSSPATVTPEPPITAGRSMCETAVPFLPLILLPSSHLLAWGKMEHETSEGGGGRGGQETPDSVPITKRSRVAIG